MGFKTPTSVVSIAVRAIDQTKKGFTTPINNAKELGRALKALQPVGIAAGTAVAGAFALTAKSLIDTRQQIAEFSDRIGISVERLSQLKFAAEQNGVAFNTLQMGLQRVNRRLGDNTTQIRETVERLGLDFDKLRQAAPGEVLFELARGFESISDQQEKLSLAGKLFDAEAIKFLQFMGQGEDALRRFTEQADALGISISTRSARAVQSINEKMGVLKASAVGLVDEFLEGLLPAFNAFTSTESLENMRAMQESMRYFGEIIGGVVKAAVLLTTTLNDVIGPGIVVLVERFKLQFFKLRDFFVKLMTDVIAELSRAVEMVINNIIQEFNRLINILPQKLRGAMGIENNLPVLNLGISDKAGAFFHNFTSDTKRLKSEIDALDYLVGQGVERVENLSGNLFSGNTPDVPDVSSSRLDIPDAPERLDAGNIDETMGKVDELNTSIQTTNINLISLGQTLQNSLGNALGDFISGAKSASDAFADMGRSIARSLGNVMAQLVTMAVTQNALNIAGQKIMKAAQSSATAGFAAMIPTLATAATLSAIATGGASVKAAALVPVAVAANNAIATGLNAMFAGLDTGDQAGGLAGQAHDGMTTVPKEGTYILDKGERVLSPNQNTDLTEFLKAPQPVLTPSEIVINLDGEVLARAMENLVDRKVININSSAII